MKAWIDAALIFTCIMSGMMGIVWLTSKLTSIVEPIVLPILEDMIADSDE